MSVALVDPVSSGTLFVTELIERSLPFSVVVSGPLPPVFEQQIKQLVAERPWVEVLRIGEEAPVADVARHLRAKGVDNVVCGAETGVRVADALRAALDISPRNTGPSELRLDKFAAQSALGTAGLASIPSILVRSPDDLRGCAEWTYPAVVKPVSSAGTDGVRRVGSPEELRAATADVLGHTNALGWANEGVVVQPVVEGTEYVVDGYRHADEHVVASVCRYRKSVIRGSPVYDVLEWLDWDEVPAAERLRRYLADVLDCLGVRVGTFHAEFFLTDDDWVLIELGLRPHGGGHPSYTKALTGASQVSAEVDAAVTGRSPVDGGMKLTRRGCVRFFSVRSRSRVVTAPTALVRKVSGVLNAAVELDVGDIVEPPRSLFDTFEIGFVVLSGHSREEVTARMAEVDAIFAECVHPVE